MAMRSLVVGIDGSETGYRAFATAVRRRCPRAGLRPRLLGRPGARGSCLWVPEKAVRGCHQDFPCHSPRGEDASSWCSRSSTWHSSAWSSSSASRAELQDDLAIEIVMLRHEVAVLRDARSTDLLCGQQSRALLAGLSRLVSRARRGGFFVQPATLFALAPRPRATTLDVPTPPVRSTSVAAGAAALVVRLARENPTWGYWADPMVSLPASVSCSRLPASGRS